VALGASVLQIWISKSLAGVYIYIVVTMVKIGVAVPLRRSTVGGNLKKGRI
jgi:hypothetical protein